MNKLWLLAVFAVILIIIVSSLIIWLRSSPGQPLSIIPPAESQFNTEIYVDGAIARPGIYPLSASDSLDTLIQACGGISPDADLSRLSLHIPPMGNTVQPQKIDINRAEAWLLQALPGIGEVRAQAIIDYRLQFGPFKHIEEITGVPGISGSVFVKIQDLITVEE
jgi:competence protein ComEA